MKEDLTEEILKLKELPSSLFESKDKTKMSQLNKLKNQMKDELACAFGGDTSDGGYVIDGELWEEKDSKQLKWLRRLHDKYEKSVNDLI